MASGLLLANRAYLDHESPRWADSPSASGKGGLLAAVRPVIEPWDGEHGTTWIGAGLGRFDREWTDPRGFELIETPRGPLRHRRLYFRLSAWQGHYAEVANSFLWPLMHLVRHDLPTETSYYPVPVPPSESDWASYVAVNTAFAEAAAEERDAPWCWVHDYQLTLVPGILRARGFSGRLGFFLHTPFPDIAVAAPYITGTAADPFRRIIEGMLGADVIGFQTPQDVERFRDAAVTLCGAEEAEGALLFDGHPVVVAPLPVGIDVDDVLDVARRVPVALRAAPARALGIPLVVGLERADFTKGIPERLEAIAAAYRAGRRFAYVGIAAPTREGVRAYETLDSVINSAASRAREAAATVGAPFAQVRASVGWEEVVALQREADVVFTSSLADGQNLVPLQAIVAQSVKPAAERAVIITGRDAGAASTFHGFGQEGLVAVEPLDHEALTNAFCHALSGSPGRVSDHLVDAVREKDASAWATSFIGLLEAPC